MADREKSEARSKISLIVMKLLHQIGINKRIRRWRQYSWIQYETMWSFISSIVSGEYTKSFIFGSQIEGCTTPGLRSDLDGVLYLDNCSAIRNIHDAVSERCTFLMVRNEVTHPGYYNVQCLDPSSVDIPPDGFSIDRNQRLVVKSSSFFLPGSTVIHGPASSTSYGPLNLDFIMAIRVTTRSQEDISWLVRPRRCNWIKQDESDYFREKEVFLVPVGNPLSLERHLEWRISYTAVERELMWRLNNTQIACCVLMKMINKCFITPGVGEGLSSYHLKTVLFYLIDNTDMGFWKPNNLLTCLNLILKTMSLWVESGFCPNYFITNENMFLGKVYGPLRRRLYSFLVHLMDQDFKYLTQIGFDGLGQALSVACSKPLTQPHTLHAILEAVQRRHDNDDYYKLFVFWPISTLCAFYRELLRYGHTAMFHTLVHGYQSCSTVLQHCMSILIALLCSHFGCQLASSCIATNRVFCRDMEMAHMFLLNGTYSDVTTGRLKLAGFYIKLGYASLALKVLDEVDKHLKHYVSVISLMRPIEWKDETFHKIMTEEIRTEQIFRNCIALSVIYLPSEIHCTLPPLCYEMFRSVGANPDLRDPNNHYWYDWAVVDAIPWMYFLQHQTYSALGMEAQRKVALDNLFWSITQEMISHKETCLNVLAYCLRLEGLANLGFKCLLLSLECKPNHNAAVWQIFDMLNEIRNN